MAPLFTPGPVDVAPEVLAAQARPMLAQDSRTLEGLFARTAEKAHRLFKTQGRVLQSSGTGSAMQEAGLRSLVQSKVLCCLNGAFSERWLAIAEANGKQAARLEVEWGLPILPDMLADALRQEQYEAVTLVHHESSTGVANPLADLAEAVRAASPDTLLLVDAAASLGGDRLEMDAWGLDFVCAPSHLCLALPPGLALAAVSERAMQRAAQVEGRGWSSDLLLMEKHRLRDTSPATPAIPLLYALDVQLDRIFAEGLEARIERATALAQRVAQWGEGYGLPPLAPPGYRSTTVVTLRNLRRLVVADLMRNLQQSGMRIANGYGKLREETLRIATMGETQPQDLDALLELMETFIPPPQ